MPKNAVCSLALVGGGAGVEGTTVIPDNTWVHLACTYDGLEIKLYVDGELDGATPATGAIQTNDQPLVIGKNLLNSWNDFFGRIDEVRIWNVARTAGEIETSRNTPLTGTETGLVGYWRFDEGAGTTAADATANGNDGTLIGSPTWVDGVVFPQIFADGFESGNTSWWSSQSP